MYDIIIIGAGPSGLAASIYALRAGKSVLVLEEKNYGGQIINTLDIENYPGENHISGFDFADKLYNQALEQGANIFFEKVVDIKNSKVKKVITEKSVYKCKAIIIATGNVNRKLDLPNEDSLIGKGVSYCATCDGAFYKGKAVAVIGGGNTALEDALYLSNIANTVYLIHRRDTFRGDEKTINLLKNKDNVKFVYNSVVTKLNANNVLESIEVTKKDNKKETIKVDGIFIAIGRIPENDFFKDLIKIDESGYIIAKENCHTNKKGIFAAGDIRKKEIRQLVTATSDGAVAAMEACKYINN